MTALNKQKVLATFECLGVEFEVVDLPDDDMVCIAPVNSDFFPAEIWIEVPSGDDNVREHDGKVIVNCHGAHIEIV